MDELFKLIFIFFKNVPIDHSKINMILYTVTLSRYMVIDLLNLIKCVTRSSELKHIFLSPITDAIAY